MLGPNRYRLVVCRLWNFHCLLLFHEFHESFLDFPYFFSLLDFFIWIDLIAKFIVDSCATSPCAPGELCVCVSFRFHISGAQLDISLYSSVAEHWSCKPGVVSSNLTGGIADFFFVGKFVSMCLSIKRKYYSIFLLKLFVEIFPKQIKCVTLQEDMYVN